MHDASGGNLHHHSFGWFAVLYEHYVISSDGLNGVYFCTCWGCILPYDLLLLCHFGHSILMRHEDVSVRQ